jgi:trehalose 6-phosphate synthase
MIVVSHRGPYSFVRRADGTFETRRGAGGIVSALTPLLARQGHLWVAAAMSDDDRAAVHANAAHDGDIDLALLDIDPTLHRMHYDVVSNAVLWFLYHALFDLPRRPRFDHRFREAWDAYRAVNRVFADAVNERAADGDVVLVQDYQLALTPGIIRAARPDLRVAHFTHTPFSGPSMMRVLPDDVSGEICTSMASGPAGFHTARWVAQYRSTVTELLGVDAPAFAASFGPDREALAEVAESDETAAARDALDELVGDRHVILRTDRMEPSNNIVRGFLAYDRFLETHPEWHDRVVFVAYLYPSRQGLADYLAYAQEVDQAASRVNERWARGDWMPVVVDSRDDFPRSVAGLQRSDVLLVNPIKDGLNLVAKEGPILNRRDGALCLSREAGAYEELHDAAVGVHPYDLEQTAAALHAALEMDPAERRARAKTLYERASARTPHDWLVDQLRACGVDPDRVN